MAKKHKGAPRPFTQTVRLTEAQVVLAKERFAHERGMTWQKLLVAAVNAWLRGQLVVHADGSTEWNSAGSNVVSYLDDDEAVSLDDLEDYPGREHASPPPKRWGTRQLADLAELTTGRRVKLDPLRRLIRTDFPQARREDERYYVWGGPDDPQVVEIIRAIAAGRLDEISREGLRVAQAGSRTPSEA